MNCTIIISVYKDTDSLDLILESLSEQTILPDEVIISEDGNSDKMAEYLLIAKMKYEKLDILHLFQEDISWRKNVALNRAVLSSKHEYLIFIDGDCIPHRQFLDEHLEYAVVGCNMLYINENGIWGNRVLAEKPTKKSFLF